MGEQVEGCVLKGGRGSVRAWALLRGRTKGIGNFEQRDDLI